MQSFISPTSSRYSLGLLCAVVAATTLYRCWMIPRLGITLYVDEAQYWTWAQDLAWGYFSKPPMIAALIAFTTQFFGDGLLAVKLSTLILYPATACMLYQLALTLFTPSIAWRSGLALMLIPLVSALGLFVSTDAPLLFFWTASLYFWVRALETNHWRDWLWLGICTGLGLLSKYTMAVFFPCALLYLLLDSKRRQHLKNGRLWLALILALLILSPNLIWNALHHFPTLQHTADITHVQGDNDKQGNLAEFIGAQVLSLGPGIALGFIAALFMAWRARHNPRIQLLLCFCLPLLGLVCLQALRSEANGNWAAPAWITGILLAVVWFDSKSPRYWWAALSLNVALMLGVYHIQDIYQLSNKPLPAKMDFLKRARGWDQLAQQVRPYLQSHPEALLVSDNRTLLAHLLYELRDLHPQYAAWNPQHSLRDHYTLTASLDEQHRGRNVIFISNAPDLNKLAAHFQDSELLTHIKIGISPGRAIEVDVVALRHFLGYANR